MDITRRTLLKGIAGGGLLLASGAGPLEAKMSTQLPPQAVGILYDATLCVGCKSCMVNCKKYNSVEGGALYSKNMKSPPYESEASGGIWDAPTELSGKTLNIIKVYRNGTGKEKDAAVNGYSYLKQQCLHCVSPSCVSVCPAGALRKDKVNGVVYYVEGKCIGCRYCQLACPFGIPRYEWDKASPQVRKCQLCNHRYKEGKYAACAEYCPTGATIFGKTADLRREAEKRVSMKPGTEYAYPVQTVNSSDRLVRRVSHYVNGVLGMKEAGGTQSHMIAGVPFELLGFSKNLPTTALPELTWAYIAKIPSVIAAVLIGGSAVYAFTHRKEKGDK